MIQYLILLKIPLFSGTISTETDFPLHGVSPLFVVWNLMSLLVNVCFNFQV